MVYVWLFGAFAILFAAIFYLARREREKSRREREELHRLSAEEARCQWLERAEAGDRWKGRLRELSLDRLRQGLAGVIDFDLVNLSLGLPGYEAPEVLTRDYRIIGVMDLGDVFWVCCKDDGESVWELGGNESTREIENARCPSLFHYLLETDRTYE